MAPPDTPPPPGGDRDRGPAIIALFWTQCVIVLIFVSLRFYARTMVKNVGADDWVMLFTMILFFATSGFATSLCLHGGMRHLYYLSPEQISTVTKLDWSSQVFAIVVIGLGKVSTAILLLRIMGPNTVRRKWFLYVCMAFTAISTTLGALFLWVQCNPPRALWEEVPGSKCWDPQVNTDYQIANGSWNAFFDLSLALLPITIIWNLRMKTKSKIGLCILMGLSVFAAVSAAIKVSTLVSLNARSDLTWATYKLYIWGSLEMFIIIVFGSIAPLKPLWYRFVRGRKDIGRARSGYPSKHFNHVETPKNIHSASFCNTIAASHNVGRLSDQGLGSDSDEIGLNDIKVRQTLEVSSVQGDETTSYQVDKSFESGPAAVIGHNLV